MQISPQYVHLKTAVRIPHSRSYIPERCGHFTSDQGLIHDLPLIRVPCVTFIVNNDISVGVTQGSFHSTPARCHPRRNVDVKKTESNERRKVGTPEGSGVLRWAFARQPSEQPNTAVFGMGMYFIIDTSLTNVATNGNLVSKHNYDS